MEKNKDRVEALCETRFLKLFDLNYREGKHYFDVSRNEKENLMFVKSDDEFKATKADAVSIAAIVNVRGEEPKLLLSYEYRYPCGQFLLSPPAGLIDKEDREKEDALEVTAIRELKEEMGIDFLEGDRVEVINPLLFSSPGMTDESNALVLVEVNRDSFPELSQDGAVGTELFAGFEILTKEEARGIMSQGTDKNGIYYSVYTWAILSFFAYQYK